MRASELNKTSVVEIGGEPHLVESVQVQQPSARGGATLYKARFRRARDQQKVDQTFKGDDVLKACDLEKCEVQFLYQSGDSYAFMNLGDYSQFEMREAEIHDVVPYLVDDMEGIIALISGGRIIAIQLPDVVEMVIEECDPSMKGASATSRNKPAKLTTGLVVPVPEYLSPGERIRVDTRTNQYVSRA